MRRLLAFAFAVLLPAAAAAGPQDIERALRGEPATLMDLSMARLEAFLQADGILGGYYGWVHYQDEQIRVMAWSLSLPNTEEACRELVNRIRRLADVDPETGFPNEPASRFANFFSYVRLDETAIDRTYMETLDSMFRISAVIGIAGDGQAYVCQGPLLGTGASVSRE